MMMSKYKSLLFREILISRKHNIAVLLIVLLYVATLFLAFILIDDKDKENMIIMQCVTLSGITAVVATEDDEVVKSDIKTKWRSFSYALPITAMDKTMTKFILKTANIVIGAVICLVCTAAVQNIFSVSLFSCVMTVYLLSVALFMLYEAFYSGFILRASNEKQYKIYSAIAFVVILVLDRLVRGSGIKINFNDPNLISKMIKYFIQKTQLLSLWSVPVMIAALAVNFIVTLKCFERREN